MNDEQNEREHLETVQELERLLACYQIASSDDKAVIWAVLNKYAPQIEDIRPVRR